MTFSIRRLALIFALFFTLFNASCSTFTPKPFPADISPDNNLPAGIHSDPTQYKFIKLMMNFNDEKSLAEDSEIVKRAAAIGYTDVLISDVKFMKWDFMGDQYAQNAKKFVTLCHSLNIKVWAACAPMGYAEPLLMRDPNLAEGLPVNADFIVDQGLFLKPYDPDLKLENGDFQKFDSTAVPGDPSGWTSSNFGKSVNIDERVTWNNKPTLRIDPSAPTTQVTGEAAAAHESAYSPGVSQSIAVKPFHYYHVHAMVKTQGKNLKRGTQIEILADESPTDKTVLNYQTPLLATTTEWQSFDMTFNSLEYSKVKLTLPGRQSHQGGGAGDQGAETIWWADISIEPGQFVNLVRRDGAPLTLSATRQSAATSEKIPCKEGKDLTPIIDPLMGHSPGAGHFTIWHTPPVVSTPIGTHLRVGDIVHATYYVPAIIHTDQVMCCMCEPKTMQLVQWEIHRIHTTLHPDGYFMGHDELRSQGYDKSCEDTGKSMHEILADNVHDITQMIKKEDPGKPICTWSDLFDPFHNAKNNGKRYYLVKGISPWYGSWTGLDPDVIIMNWHGPFDGNTRASIKFFSDLGNPQILSGYYDKPVEAFKTRLQDASHYPKVIGSMYTTWIHNFNDLQPFMNLLNTAKTQSATTQQQNAAATPPK